MGTPSSAEGTFAPSSVTWASVAFEPVKVITSVGMRASSGPISAFAEACASLKGTGASIGSFSARMRLYERSESTSFPSLACERAM
jgi:hypothetical protein